jgi:hypothetical protein
MITMTITYSTPDEFLKAQIALWGFDEVERLFALGAEIVPDGDKGFKWSLPALDTEPDLC